MKDFDTAATNKNPSGHRLSDWLSRILLRERPNIRRLCKASKRFRWDVGAKYIKTRCTTYSVAKHLNYRTSHPKPIHDAFPGTKLQWLHCIQWPAATFPGIATSVLTTYQRDCRHTTGCRVPQDAVDHVDMVDQRQLPGQDTVVWLKSI